MKPIPGQQFRRQMQQHQQNYIDIFRNSCRQWNSIDFLGMNGLKTGENAGIERNT